MICFDCGGFDMKKFAVIIFAAALLLSSCAANTENVPEGAAVSADSVAENIPEEEKTVRMSPEDLLKYAEENLSEFTPSNATTLSDGVEYGEFEHITYHSDYLDRDRYANILLPAGYDTSKKYPVLYALHGYWGDEYSLLDQGDGSIKFREVLGNLISSGEAADMIVVFPDIFCHPTKEDCDGMNPENNAAYDAFITELTEELMPYIEENYPVATGRENTAITGFSMGGREALNIGIKCADKFGYIGAVCPAPGLTDDCVAAEDMVFSEENTPCLVMISAGSNDTVVYDNPEKYHNIFTDNGVPHIWHMVSGGEHWGKTICPHIYNFLRFIFK